MRAFGNFDFVEKVVFEKFENFNFENLDFDFGHFDSKQNLDDFSNRDYMFMKMDRYVGK